MIKGLTFIPSESVSYHYKSTTQYPVILILGVRWPITSKRSLLFLVAISLIFLGGRGLAVISSNVHISATELTISFKFVLMTSVGGRGACVAGTSLHLNDYS